MTDAELPPADAVCDGGDLDCGSGLLLIIRSAMAPLAPGGVLEVRSRESSVREDLPAWCRLVGHDLLGVRAGDGAEARYRIRKQGADADLDQHLQQARDHVWQVRARWGGGMQSKVAARNHALAVGQPASFDTEDPAPSALEHLLAAVAGALCSGLQWRLQRQGHAVRNLEVVARGRAADILVFLGVHADGNPGLHSLECTIYLDADADADQVDATLQDTLRRCPVWNTITRSVPATVRWRGA